MLYKFIISPALNMATYNDKFLSTFIFLSICFSQSVSPSVIIYGSHTSFISIKTATFDKCVLEPFLYLSQIKQLKLLGCQSINGDNLLTYFTL